MLNLSYSANSREDSEFRTRTNHVLPAFAVGPFLGNIGGPVRSLPDEFYDDEIDRDVVKDGDGVRPGQGDGNVSVVEPNVASSSNEIEEVSV